MPKEKNQHKSAAASDEKFRDFFTTTVADIPAEMVRREEEAAEEHKGLFGRLFGHAKPKQAPQAGMDLELPTGEVLLGADALAKHDGEEPLDLDLTLRTADPGTDFPQPKAEVPAAPEKPAVPDRPAPQPAPENKPEPPKAPAAPAPQPEPEPNQPIPEDVPAPQPAAPEESYPAYEEPEYYEAEPEKTAQPEEPEPAPAPVQSLDEEKIDTVEFAFAPKTKPILPEDDMPSVAGLYGGDMPEKPAKKSGSRSRGASARSTGKNARKTKSPAKAELDAFDDIDYDV